MLKPAFRKPCSRMAALLAALLSLLCCGWQWPFSECPNGNCPRTQPYVIQTPPRRVQPAVQPSQIRKLCATTDTMLGPDIGYEYATDDQGRTTRRTDGVEMDRIDVLTPAGWADWKWYDTRKDRTWFVNGQNKNQPAAVGVSQWHSKGPNVPASANCMKCHRTKAAKAVTGINLSLLAKAGPVEAGLFAGGFLGVRNNYRGELPPARSTRQPAQASVCPAPPRGPPVAAQSPTVTSRPVQGPAGPAGPTGPAGTNGAPGTPGKPGQDAVVDYERIVRDVLTAMPKTEPGPTDAKLVAIVEKVFKEHKSELKGENGKTPIIDYEAIAKLVLVPPVKIDYDEIASRVKVPVSADKPVDVDALVADIVKRLPPLYIGAKDITGKVTMPATPVRLGQDVFIQLDPPTLVDPIEPTK